MRQHIDRDLPTLAVIDDFFGRNVSSGRNADRENLCAHFLWRDVTGDAAALASRQHILKPMAQVVFARAQTPDPADIGDLVENDLQVALDFLREGWYQHPRQPNSIVRPWSMLLLDLCFYTGRVTEESHRGAPGMPEGRPGDDNSRSYFGLTLLDAIHREFPELPIFILSSKPREEVSLELSHRGALGFLARDDLSGPALLQEALWQHGLLPDPIGDVVGNSLPVLLALREARRAARHRENLLIQGNRGTGKELLARYVHRVSNSINQERERPFVAVNSAGFSSSLFAAELFGIEPRTATGVDGKVGLVEMANHGDLFLDEIADMLPEVQAAVLRLLQDRQVSRVGSRQSRDIDVRFISATNADLEEHSCGLRPDLLDRLRLGGTISLPSLRDRPSDIPLLVNRFIREAEAQRKAPLRHEITPEALEMLHIHDWPGNIRELRSVVFDAVNRFPDVEHLVPEHLRLGAGRKQKEAVARRIKGPEPQETNTTIQDKGLDALLGQLAVTRFDTCEVGHWAGRFGELQHEYLRLVARMLQMALEVTKRRTPEKPEGTIQIHPAAKLLTGDSTLSASKAADVVKRLLGPLESELEGDLRVAYDTAIRLRPKSTGSSSRRTSTTDT